MIKDAALAIRKVGLRPRDYCSCHRIHDLLIILGSVRQKLLNNAFSNCFHFPKREPGANFQSWFNQFRVEQRDWYGCCRAWCERAALFKMQSAIELLSLKFESALEQLRRRSDVPSTFFNWIKPY